MLLKYTDSILNPHTSIAQKVTDEVVFRRFQDEGVDFFKSDLTDLFSIFDVHLLENTNLSPFSLYFSVSFYIKIFFLVRRCLFTLTNL